MMNFARKEKEKKQTQEIVTARKREKAGEREEEDGKTKQNKGNKNKPTGCKNSQKYWTVSRL